MKFFKSLLPILLPLFAACTDGPTADGLRVTVSIEPLRYFVEAIGGDRCSVTTLVPAAVSPETYELTPQQLVELGSSQLYFRVGTLGFERTTLEPLSTNNPGVALVNASEGIQLLPGGAGDYSDGGDQHTWTAPSSARQIACNILDALCSADSLHSDYYTANCDSLLHHIDDVDDEVRTLLKDVKHRSFLIFHPALGYYARDYGLRQMAVETDGREPSVERMQQLTDQCRADSVRVVFVQDDHAGRAARRLAETIGARLVSISPLSYNWDEQLINIAKALAEE